MSPIIDLVFQDFADIVEMNDSNNEDKKNLENQLETDFHFNHFGYQKFNTSITLNSNLSVVNILEYSDPQLSIFLPPPDTTLA